MVLSGRGRQHILSFICHCFFLPLQFDGENMYVGMNDNNQEFLSANQVSVTLLIWAVPKWRPKWFKSTNTVDFQLAYASK